MYLQYAFSIFLGLTLMAALRFVYLLMIRGTKDRVKRRQPCRTAVVMGSGGHTSEMVRIVRGLTLKNHTPRLYVIAEGDKMSQDKVAVFEASIGNSRSSDVLVRTIPRARQVKQSYFTSIFSTLRAIMSTFSCIFSFRPDLVLCNGPGTCIPVCFCAYVLTFFGLKTTKIIYVESLCRVQRLSLSGLILYYLYIADYVFVQWTQLKKLYPRTHYLGRFM